MSEDGDGQSGGDPADDEPGSSLDQLLAARNGQDPLDAPQLSAEHARSLGRGPAPEVSAPSEEVMERDEPPPHFSIDSQRAAGPARPKAPAVPVPVGLSGALSAGGLVDPDPLDGEELELHQDPVRATDSAHAMRSSKVTPVRRRSRAQPPGPANPIPVAYGGGLLDGIALIASPAPPSPASPPPHPPRLARDSDRPTLPPLPPRAAPLPQRPPRATEEDAVPVLPALALGALGFVVAGVIGAGLWSLLHRPSAPSAAHTALSPLEVHERAAAPSGETTPPPDPNAAANADANADANAAEDANEDANTNAEVDPDPAAAAAGRSTQSRRSTNRSRTVTVVEPTAPEEDPWSGTAGSATVTPEEARRSLRQAQKEADAQRASEARADAEQKRADARAAAAQAKGTDPAAADEPAAPTTGSAVKAEDDPWGSGH